MAFGITVHQLNETGRRVDLAYFVRAATAPEMEDVVTTTSAGGRCAWVRLDWEVGR